MNLDEQRSGGEHIGRYVTRRLLGSGGFATVWLAYDPALDTEIALKVLAENWANDADVRRRFTEEARILWRLESDHVVRVYTVDELPTGQPYFVMEHADAGNLDDRMRARRAAGEPFSVDEAVALSIAVAEGLVAAQAQGIAHRDLKPSNVLFKSADAGERVLLADFGIARSLEAVGATTIAAGTPHYMAPEQSDGRVGAASDVYSAAVILYELLSGTVPFPYPSIGQVIRAQQTEDPPDIRPVRGDLPPDLLVTLRRGLERDPDRRQASAQQWLDELRAVPGQRTGFVPPLGATLGPEDLAAAQAAEGGIGAAGIAGVAGAAGMAGVAAAGAAGAMPMAPGAPTGGGGGGGFGPGGPGGPGGAGGPGGHGAPPPPGPPPGGRPPNRKRRQRILAVAAVVALVGTVVGIALASSGTVSAQVYRAPVGFPGPRPFSAPIPPKPLAESLLKFLHPAGSLFNRPSDAPKGSLVTFSGATPGLYGGTRQLTVCDAKALVAFLEANADKAAAWAAVEGIKTSEIRAYVATLTDVVLRIDTQVINHGFVNGRATDIPEVLQAGTAVLIDRLGVPRARCFCGNPLVPPRPLKGTIKFTGPSWSGFDPEHIGIVSAVSTLTKVVIVDVATGQPFVRPVGTSGEADEDAPPDALANSPFGQSTSGGGTTTSSSTSTTATTSTTTTTSTTEAPPTTAAPTDIASHGSVSASTTFSGQFPASAAIDGNVGTSWFSAGASDGPTSSFVWQGPSDAHIASITIVGNEHNADPANRSGFGYQQTEIQVMDSSGKVTFDQTFAGPSNSNNDIQTSVDAVGQTVRLIFGGRESPDCGGFAELQIMAS